MKIAFDAQIIYDSMKTGIGKTAECILNNIPLDEKNEYYLNIRDTRDHNIKNESINRLVERGFKLQLAPWYYGSIEGRLHQKIKMPYFMLYPRQMDVTIFFNYLIPRGVRGKTATFIHDMTYKTFPETMEHVTRLTLEKNMKYIVKRADCIFTDSLFSKNEIIKYFPEAKEKLHAITLGVDTKRFHPNYANTDIDFVKTKYKIFKNYILYLGTLEPRKNIVNIVKAYALLQKEIKTAPLLVIAGKKGWMYDEIYEVVKNENIENQVVFTGYVDDEDIPLILAGSELFIFPSIYEGFGLPPLEAMACGTAVIVSNCASLPEVVGNAGFQVDPYNVFEIEAAMAGVLSDEQKKNEQVYKGIEKSREFTWFKTGNQINQTLNMFKD